MQQVKFATVQIPALGLTGAAGFGDPQMNQSFLKKIIPQNRVGGDILNKAAKKFPGGWLIDMHRYLKAVLLFLRSCHAQTRYTAFVWCYVVAPLNQP